MKPWQHGIDLSVLRDLQAPFKAVNKPHVYGAFGLTKERDLAAAHAEGRLIFTRDGDKTVGAAMFRLLKSPGGVKDWTGTEVRFPAGDLVVDDLAVLPDYMGNLPNRLSRILARLKEGGRPIWVRAWEEVPDAVETLEMEGFRWISTQVTAGSEVRGIYLWCPNSETFVARPAPDHHPAEFASLCRMSVQVQHHDELVREAAGVGEWAQHYSSYNKGQSWTAVALRGYDPDDPEFIIKPSEMSKTWKEENPERLTATPGWTRVSQALPFITAWVEDLAERLFDNGSDGLDRVRLMRLASGGGELSRHADITDRDAGVADGKIARVHVPLVSDPSILFNSWDCRGHMREVHMEPGKVYYLDQRKPHRVKNPSGVDRIHLVIDGMSSRLLRDAL